MTVVQSSIFVLVIQDLPSITSTYSDKLTITEMFQSTEIRQVETSAGTYVLNILLYITC